MNKSTKGIIGLTLIIGGSIAMLFTGRLLIQQIIDISNSINTPQAILIAAVITGVAIKTKKGK